MDIDIWNAMAATRSREQLMLGKTMVACRRNTLLYFDNKPT